MNIEGALILVTGGRGLIGSTTIEQLLRDHNPASIVILGNLVRGDIRDRDALARTTEGMDAIAHMAALQITACATAPREAMVVRCDGSFNVVDAARQAGMKKFVVASTAWIYGPADSFPACEDHHPDNDLTWCGASKAMLEHGCA